MAVTAVAAVEGVYARVARGASSRICCAGPRAGSPVPTHTTRGPQTSDLLTRKQRSDMHGRGTESAARGSGKGPSSMNNQHFWWQPV